MTSCVHHLTLCSNLQHCKPSCRCFAFFPWLSLPRIVSSIQEVCASTNQSTTIRLKPRARTASAMRCPHADLLNPHVVNKQVMVLAVDAERGRLSLSTRQLERTKGDMLSDKKLVYEGAEEMARLYLEKNKTLPAPRTKMTGDRQHDGLASIPHDHHSRY